MPLRSTSATTDAVLCLVIFLHLNLALNDFLHILICNDKPSLLIGGFNSCSDQNTLLQHFLNFFCLNYLMTLKMRTDLIFVLNSFLIARIALLVTATYLLAVFDLGKTIRNPTYGTAAIFVITPIQPVPGLTRTVQLYCLNCFYYNVFV